MNAIESRSPGTKSGFFFGYLDRAMPLFATEDHAEIVACRSCGRPTTGTFCAFCRARAQILGEPLAPPADRQVRDELSDEVLPAELYEHAGGPTS